jgi:hypothetical protein
MTERERLIGLVQRIMDGDYSSDEEVRSLVADRRRHSVRRPSR